MAIICAAKKKPFNWESFVMYATKPWEMMNTQRGAKQTKKCACNAWEQNATSVGLRLNCCLRFMYLMECQNAGLYAKNV